MIPVILNRSKGADPRESETSENPLSRIRFRG